MTTPTTLPSGEPAAAGETKYVGCEECFGTGQIISGGDNYGGECDRCGGEGGYHVALKRAEKTHDLTIANPAPHAAVRATPDAVTVSLPSGEGGYAELAKKLGMATFGLGSEDTSQYVPRCVSAKDCVEAATAILSLQSLLSAATERAEKAERTIGHRDRRIKRLVEAMDYARSQGVRFPADDEPPVVPSADGSAAESRSAALEKKEETLKAALKAAQAFVNQHYEPCFDYDYDLKKEIDAALQTDTEGETNG